MVKNHKLAKSISQSAWGELFRQLEYKALWYGRTFFKISRWFPSSKIHNKCGFKNIELKLSERNWICKGCGEEVDRDLNASKNIKEEGLRWLLKFGTISEVEFNKYIGLRNIVPKQKLGEALSAGSNSFKTSLNELEVKDKSMSQEAYEFIS